MGSSGGTATRDRDSGSSDAAAEVTARLIGPLMRRVDVAQILARSGVAGSVGVDQVRLGEATIDRVHIQGLHATLDAGNSRLEQVRVLLRLVIRVRVRVLWVSLDRSAEFSFPFTIGTVTIPRLDNIAVSVSDATVTGTHVEVQPVNALDLGAARFSDLNIEGTLLPAVGFGLGGLDLGNVTLRDFAVPGTYTERLSIGTFAPDRPLRLPTTVISGIALPHVAVPQVSSSGAIEVPDITPQNLAPDVSLGPIRITVQPIMNMHIGRLTISDIDASSSIDRVALENISAPVSISGLHLGELELSQVTVNQITV